MKQRKKSFGMRISAFVLSFAMVCTLLAGVNVVAFAAETDEELTDTVSVLRAYNPNNGEHLMTIDEAEYNANVARGYDGEGEAWVAPIYSETEVWRAYNPNSGEHMLAPQAEVVALSQAGWQNEGLKMYSDDNMGVPIYRVFNPNATDAGSHHYCGEEEAAALVELGWQWDNNGEPVIYGVAEEPPVILVGLTDADQLTANTLEVTFDQDASLLVDKDDITVAKADGTLVLPILNMEMAADGLSAKLTLSTNFADGVDYVASLNTSEVGFTASLGEVAAVIVTTDKAQKGVVTPIEFTLYDAQGVDVTSTVDVDSLCTIDVEGEAQSDVSTPSKATLTMDEVGAEAEIVVTYNDGEGEMEDIVGKNTVTCIPAEAVVGYPVYTTLTEDEKDMYESPVNHMAKFYLGKYTSDPVTVVVGEQSDTIYFSAVNLADFSVYSYDEYEITSSDEDVMSIGTPAYDEGKQCQFTVNGNSAGTANIVITSKVNDTETPYTIPVRVVNKGTLSSITYTVDRTRMTNAAEKDYYAVSSAYATDTNGLVMGAVNGTNAADFDYEVTSGTIDGDDEDDDAISLGGNDGFHVDDTYINPAAKDGYDYVQYTAYKSKGGKKVIKATASDGEKSKSKTITINVEKLGAAVWNTASGTEQTVTYSTELTRSSALSDPDMLLQDAGGVEARLAAYVGSKFVGYVRTDAAGHTYIGSLAADQTKGSAIGSDGNYQVATCSAVQVTKASAIKAGTLAFGVKYGSKYSTRVNNGAATAGAADGEGLNALAGDTRKNIFDSSLGTYDYNPVSDMVVLNIGRVNIDFVTNPAAPATVAYDGVENIYVADPTKAANFQLLQNEESMTYVADAAIMEDFTPQGTYEATYAWVSANDDKTVVTKATKLTVGDVLGAVAKAEIITVTSRTVDSLDNDGVKAVLVARGDMNNAESDASVITGFCGADGKPIVWSTENSQYVKYAVVSEQMALNAADKALTINFLVPLNTTFKKA